ncbi:MAG: hypothetical protein Q8N08_08770 [Methanobacteriaceae archaeon]|nr:hypothetical protein [Methanobacteriaceae archaeon]
MFSSKKYRQQIDNLGLDGMEIEVTSIKRAMAILDDLDDYEKVLIKIRYNIRSDVRSIRLEYMEKLQEMEESHQGLFGRKKSTDQIIKEKKAIIKDRNIKIAAYDIVENMVDDYLSQIADARRYIRGSIKKRVG